jgi:hypothetical protein
MVESSYYRRPAAPRTADTLYILHVIRSRHAMRWLARDLPPRTDRRSLAPRYTLNAPQTAVRRLQYYHYKKACKKADNTCMINDVNAKRTTKAELKKAELNARCHYPSRIVFVPYSQFGTFRDTRYGIYRHTCHIRLQPSRLSSMIRSHTGMAVSMTM